MLLHDKELGRIEVKTLKLPEEAKNPSGTFTYSGKVLVDYNKDGDNDVLDHIRLAVVNDDGTGFREIFSGVIPKHPTANGIRFMPFLDNKRVLLGDYVLECSPDIDNCERAEIIPVKYPWGIDNNKNTFCHWSEIIIAPDNEHICWTTLMKGFTFNAIGSLLREKDRYVINNAQVISSRKPFTADHERPGYLIPQASRGGEVKQFVRGGTAISLVGGGKNSVLPDSIVQDLASEEVLQITRLPGYEETTSFSPDEKLGIVMSTRGSPKTNCAILGLLPRPYGMISVQDLTMQVYLYSVAGVRSFRRGNIGPVLIDIEKSINKGGYRGVQLNDPDEDWVYLSPMSWHPNGRKAMWPEMLRGDYTKKRIRIAELQDYVPGKAVPARRTPDDISYATHDGEEQLSSRPAGASGKIAGKHSGYFEFSKKGGNDESFAGTTQSRYVQYSDDGVIFYNGHEKTFKPSENEVVYEADLTMSGTKPGEMKCRIWFRRTGSVAPSKLLFDTDSDGIQKSFGYAEYDAVRLDVEEMSE